MTGPRSGPSSADIFDQQQRVYACAASVAPSLPHLHRVGNTWGVVPPLGGGRPTLRDRAGAYAWCVRQNRI